MWNRYPSNYVWNPIEGRNMPIQYNRQNMPTLDNNENTNNLYSASGENEFNNNDIFNELYNRGYGRFNIALSSGVGMIPRSNKRIGGL